MTTPTLQDKVIISFTSAVIFAILSSPKTFSLTGKKTKSYGWESSSENGCPYAGGIALHSLLFFLIVLIIMIDNLLFAGIAAALLALILYLV